RRHTRFSRDWSSDVCSSDLISPGNTRASGINQRTMANDLISIPCVLMRGGTSKGPFFLATDLPSAPVERDRLLLAALGSGHPLRSEERRVGKEARARWRAEA